MIDGLPLGQIREYIQISGKLYSLHVMKNTDTTLCFWYNDRWIVYDPIRDGAAMDGKKAVEKYPEYFV